MATATLRPDKSEYPVYAEAYVSRVPDGDVVAILGRQLDETLALINSIPEGREASATRKESGASRKSSAT